MTDWPARPYIADNTLHVCDWLDLMQALPDASVDMILTDMPYGTTACNWDTVIDLDVWWVEVRRVMKPRGAVVCTASQPFTSRLVSSNYEWFRYEWVWCKNVPTNVANAIKMPLRYKEDILIFSEQTPKYFPIYRHSNGYKVTNKSATSVYNFDGKPRNYNNPGRLFPSNVLNFNNHNGLGKQHPTQKPVALFEYLIKTYTQPGELVVDPFVGSGTTPVAAKTTGRRFICGDQSPEYIDIARKRVFPTFGQPPRRKREEKPITDLPLFAGLAS